MDDAEVDRLLDEGWSVKKITDLARKQKALQDKGFVRDTGGGWVRPSSKPIVDPMPAEAPSTWDKVVAAAEGAKEGLGAHSARMAETFAFGIPANILDAVNLSSPQEREAAKAKTRGDRFLGLSPEDMGAVSGFALSGAAGPENVIAKGVHQGFQGLTKAAPVLAKTAPGRILAATGEAAVTGAGIGAAQKTVQGGTPDEIKEAAQEGGTLAAPFGTTAQLVTEGYRKVLDKVIPGLTNRIINEIAEGTTKASATSRKRLEAADEAILAEVINGPDAKTVRDAYLSGADSGRKGIAPIIDRVGENNAEAYSLFEQTGRNRLSLDDYMARIDNALADAIDGGKDRVASVLEKFKERVALRAGQARKGFDLEQARGLTTDFQGIAASTLGSLHEHANARAYRQAQAAVTAAMDETLSAAAAGLPELEAAASQIRGNNRRLNALLSIDDALRLRVPKEVSQKPWLVRKAEEISKTAPLGGAAGFVGSGDPLGAAAGVVGTAALQYGLPGAARAVNKAATTAAINRLRAESPSGIVNTATPVAPGVSAILDANEKDKERKKRRNEVLRERYTRPAGGKIMY